MRSRSRHRCKKFLVQLSVSRYQEKFQWNKLTLNKDVLGSCASATDSRDTSLVKLCKDGRCRFIVELVVAVKDDFLVILEFSGQVGPESTKVSGGSENGAIVTSEVLSVKNGVGTSVCDEVDNLLVAGKVGSIYGGGHRALSHTFHNEWNTEDVHTTVNQSLDCGGIWESVVLIHNTWEVALSEFSSRFVSSDPLQFSSSSASR